MMALIAIFIAKLLSPIAGLFGMFWRWFAVERINLILGSLALAVISEIVLQSTQNTREFDLVVFCLGVVAAAVWVAVGHYGLKRVFRRGV